MGDVSSVGGGAGSAVAAAHMQGTGGKNPVSETKKVADAEFQKKQLETQQADEVAKEVTTNAPPKRTGNTIDVAA